MWLGKFWLTDSLKSLLLSFINALRRIFDQNSRENLNLIMSKITSNLWTVWMNLKNLNYKVGQVYSIQNLDSYCLSPSKGVKVRRNARHSRRLMNSLIITESTFSIPNSFTTSITLMRMMLSKVAYMECTIPFKQILR